MVQRIYDGKPDNSATDFANHDAVTGSNERTDDSRANEFSNDSGANSCANTLANAAANNDANASSDIS